jgi:hypothetical protein
LSKIIEVNAELEIAEMTTKLGGVILRKAEMENDFEKVYLKVFEKMVEVELTGGENLLEILGEVGG